jgi:Pyridoxamine 5'-phosphate oxidase
MPAVNTLAETAPAFVEMAHRIVWCTVATVDGRGRPRSRILHPIWQWDGADLVGWIATGPTPLKRAHLEASPNVSCSYWEPSHDTCVAECRATWAFDDETRTMVWNLFAEGPPPVGYDPAIVPAWDGPTSPAFAALRLEPWRLRVFPGTMLLQQEGDVLTWAR